MIFTSLTPRRRHTPSVDGATVLIALACLTACADPAPTEGRTPFDPPAEYADIWREVESCSGRTGDFGRVRWMLTDSFPGRRGLLANWTPDRVITLRRDLDVALPIVGHEILHDLLDGDPEHQDPAWLECALPVFGAHADDP